MAHRIGIVWTLLSISTLCAQPPDTRAPLDVHGGIKELSVSPSGRIWFLTTAGCAYYTEALDSSWNYHAQFARGTEKGYDSNAPHLERISFFNADTAILTGYISAGAEGLTKNGLYRTTDGGITWALIDFGADMWVYDAYANASGRAWIGGSSGDLLHTDDFGHHWRKLASPYDQSSRLNSIFMRNNEEGIIGALHNHIHLTSNNWATRRSIKTPFDQGLYKRSRSYGDDRIEKVLLWKDYIVVDQDGHIYYTAHNQIHWKPFPIPITDFELDPVSQELYAVAKDLGIVMFMTPTEHRTIPGGEVNTQPVDLTVVGGKLYAYVPPFQVAGIDAMGMHIRRAFTTAHAIHEPDIVRRSGALSWGISEDQLYLRHGGGAWYREAVLPFAVADIALLDDSSAVVWDGDFTSERYDLRTHALHPYTPNGLLADLLSAPITSVRFNFGSAGCYHHDEQQIDYTRDTDSTLITTGIRSSSGPFDSTSHFHNTIASYRLATILELISKNPEAGPSGAELSITPQDIEDYEQLVRERGNEEDDPFFGRRIPDAAFYRSVPLMLDTVDRSVIRSALLKREGYISTTSSWFTVDVLNNKGDTLRIERHYYHTSGPWHLPWLLQANGLHITSCSVELSKFIVSAMPDNFVGRDIFSNASMILAIADELYRRRVGE